MESLIAGRADFAVLVPSNVVYMGFQTDILRIVASSGTAYDDAVIFPSESPIQGAKDLRGKRIGFAPSTSAQMFLTILLGKAGVQWNEIQPVVLQPSTGLAALKGKQVDAVVTWQPWRLNIAKALTARCGKSTTTKAFIRVSRFMSLRKNMRKSIPND